MYLPQAPVNAPYAAGGAGVAQDPWDAMADDIQRMQLGTEEFNRVNAERLRQLNANVHAGHRDNVKGVFAAQPHEATPVNQRLRPEELPAAGVKQNMDRGGAPFALHVAPQSPQTMAQLQGSQVRGAGCHLQSSLD